MGQLTSKETLMDMFDMRISGKKYIEIGEKYGVSRQAVEQLLKKVICEKSRTKADRYPARKGLSEYMDDNRLTVQHISDASGVSRENLRRFLDGKPCNLKTVDALIKATGLTYEELTHND